MSYQPFEPLSPPMEAALRASIERFGVLVPITTDQTGAVLDGNHRKRIATELGVTCPTLVRVCESDEERRLVAATLNMTRRPFTAEQRREMVLALAVEVDAEGVGVHSPATIAMVVGVSRTQVEHDISTAQHASGCKLPTRRRGLDGKVRSSTRHTTRTQYGPYIPHPALECFPLMNKREIASLGASIEKHGQILPCLVWGRYLVDGRCRWLACELMGVRPRVEQVECDRNDLGALVMSYNLYRANYNETQLTCIGARVAAFSGVNEASDGGGA